MGVRAGVAPHAHPFLHLFQPYFRSEAANNELLIRAAASGDPGCSVGLAIAGRVYG